MAQQSQELAEASRELQFARPQPNRLPARRNLHFDDLSQVLGDAQAMSRCPHGSLGNWTLAQVCKHLADTIHGSIDGIRLGGHRLRRVFLGRVILRWTYKNGIPPGVTLDPRLNPPPGCEFESAFAALQCAVARYSAHTGRLQPHPVFGRLKRHAWDRLHCFHCAHHLSFIVPGTANHVGVPHSGQTPDALPMSE